MHKMRLRNTLCFIAYITITACQNPQPEQFHHTLFTFGTLLDITLSDISPELADSTFDLLDKDYQAYHDSWTPWQKSNLSNINTAIRENKTIIPAPDILPMIQQAITLSRQSENLFNPAIGNLINLWQFHKHEDPDIRPPDAIEIKKLLDAHPVMSDLRFEGNYLSSSNPAIQLNFGAFAKGYAIDLSFTKLRQLGIKNAIINAGGDLRVSGKHGTRLWNIGIKHPRSDDIIATIEARDGESVFTSGDYERYYIHEGNRYHHILDSETGYPTKGTSSVTVIHDNASIADAAATAMLVAGPKKWHEIAKNMGITYVMLIEEHGTIHMNPKMAERIKLKDASKYSIELSQPL